GSGHRSRVRWRERPTPAAWRWCERSWCRVPASTGGGEGTAAGGISSATWGGVRGEAAALVLLSGCEGEAPTPGGRNRNSCNPSLTNWLVAIASASAAHPTVIVSISPFARRRRAARSVTGGLLDERRATFLRQLPGERYVSGGEDRDQYERGRSPQHAMP